MLACFDFGNTLLKYILFQGDEKIQQGILDPVHTLNDIQKLYRHYAFSKSILSSVIHHNQNINTWLKTNSSFHLLGMKTKVNFITSSVKNPIEIGADRLALCCAAINETKEKSYKLVIAVGSCITYNFINLNNVFLGGAISPGIAMRYYSMHEHTALLPLLKPNQKMITPPLVGYDTKTNLESGVIYGMADEIDGMISRYQSIYNKINIYLTGGDMNFLLPYLKSKIFADSDFLAKGLKWIAYENC